MKGKELKNGQYFRYGYILARRIGENIAFFNSHINLSIEPLDNWIYQTVEPITFQEAILALIQECIDNNKPVDPLPPKVQANALKPNQFFLQEENTIGFVYCKDKACYLNDGGVRGDYLIDMPPVIPLTMHQATLILIQNEN